MSLSSQNPDINRQDKVPGKESFVPILSDKVLDKEKTETSDKIAEMIYTVLFSRKLSKLTKQELTFLSTLLNSENSTDSEEILKTITIEYPQTRQNIINIRNHRKLFPLPMLDEEGTAHIHNIQASIFDIFSEQSPNTELIKLLHNIVRKSFLQRIKKELGDNAYQICKKNYKITAYNIADKKISLSTIGKKQARRFEKYAIPILKKTIKTAHIPHLKLMYVFDLKENEQINIPNINTQNIYNKSNQQINFPINQNITRENCYIPNKEQIYDAIIDSETQNRNFYIQSEPGTGKTHLAQAITQKLQREFPKQKIIYITTADFKEKFYKSAHKDRLTREIGNNTNNFYKQTNQFRNAFNNAKIIIIDDIEQLQGNKFATQQMFKQITETTGAKIIMTSYLNMTDIIINKKIIIQAEDRKDYIRSSIPELYNPILLKPQKLDTKERKHIAEKFLNTELFTPPASQGIVNFLAESTIPLSRFPAIFDSIKFNSNGNMVDNDPRTAFEIIQEMTGTIIKPNTEEILQILLDTFNSDEITKYINIKNIGGFPRTGAIRDFPQIKGRLMHTTDGTLLRAAIYFIKTYNPQKSFEDIGSKFNRSNANILYNEFKDYLQDNPKIKKYFESEITHFLQKKYGLLEDA